MSAESATILKEVQERLQGVLDCIKDLPQGYQYKVREMLSCAETVVSMYHDVQSGVIPEILKEMREESLTQSETQKSAKLDIGDIDLKI